MLEIPEIRPVRNRALKLNFLDSKDQRDAGIKMPVSSSLMIDAVETRIEIEVDSFEGEFSGEKRREREKITGRDLEGRRASDLLLNLD